MRAFNQMHLSIPKIHSERLPCGNFGEKFLSNGPGIFLGTKKRNGIELYHLQNTGKFFASSRHQAWHE